MEGTSFLTLAWGNLATPCHPAVLPDTGLLSCVSEKPGAAGSHYAIVPIDRDRTAMQPSLGLEPRGAKARPGSWADREPSPDAVLTGGAGHRAVCTLRGQRGDWCTLVQKRNLCDARGGAGHSTHVLNSHQGHGLMSAVRLPCLEETEAQPEGTAGEPGPPSLACHAVLRVSAAKDS